MKFESVLGMGKNWIKTGLIASGATRLAGKLKGPSAAILMYHSVTDDLQEERHTLGGIGHSTEVFSRQVELIAREYVPVSLDDVLRALAGGQGLRPRSVVVTFDDGYADNHDVAMPILARFGVPATFYITVDCVQNAEAPWPSRLRYAFYTTRQMSWRDTNSREWKLQDSQQREQAYLYACDLCAKIAGDEQRAFVTAVEKALETEPSQSFQRLMMTWDQTRALLKAGHIVASHTLTHPNMAYIDEGAARKELSDSKQKLEEVLQSPVVHFSYPCPALWPHWNESTRKMSQEIGYQTAVTTVGGCVRANDDPLALRRVRPSKEVDGLRWNLECTFMGRAM